MSVVATALRKLIELGVSGEALLDAVERIEQAAVEERASTLQQAVEIASRRADDELAARKAKAAERSRKHREKKNVTVTPVTSDNVTVTLDDVTERKSASCARVVILPSSLRSEGIPPTPPSEATPKGAARPEKRQRRSRFVPESWNPTEADAAYGVALGFTPGEMERELAKFRRFEFARPYSDWSRTLHSWLDRAAERRPKPAHERPDPHDAKLDAKRANLARAFSGADAASGRDWKP